MDNAEYFTNTKEKACSNLKWGKKAGLSMNIFKEFETEYLVHNYST